MLPAYAGALWVRSGEARLFEPLITLAGLLTMLFPLA